MNTMPLQDVRTSGHSMLRSYLLEARYEFLRVLRTPSFAVPSLLFPALFYTLFGILLNRGSGNDAARYLLATYGVFGVMGTGLFAFGVTVAIERERGFVTYKRALPMPPGAYLFAKMAVAMLFAVMTSLLLDGLAMVLAHVSLAPWQWWALLGVNVAGVLPFCAIGLYIGTLVGGQGSPALVNMIYLPMSFLSGLWLPLKMLPAIFASIAPVWPSWQLAQVGLKVIGMDAGGRWWLHALVLAAVTVGFFLLAQRRLRRGG
jgi:ABC-2 type transport system permease protein